MRPEIHATLVKQHGLLTRTQALASGMDPRELRRLVTTGDLVRVRRGVYADGTAWREADEFRARPLLRVRAAHLTLSVAHHFSHDSAGLVHRLWLPDARKSLVHLTRPRVLGRRIDAGVKHHKAAFLPSQTRVRDGLPVLDRARTAVDLAREHGLTPGVAAISSARRLGTSLSELHHVVEQMWCWPGSRVIQAALDLSDVRLESYGEAGLLVLLTELGIGDPVPQFELSDGRRRVACDFRIGRHIFEFDGFLKIAPGNPSGEPGPEVLWKEKKRQDFVTGFKLGMSRVTWHDLHGGRAAARSRLRREFEDTCRRFGTDISDLAPYIVHRRYPPSPAA